ncbi:16986_t:CDS:2 [Entrophospora sp. SA101]|nr:16986_t:CDS:2 [Entrophospora sp. SA101]
MSEENSTFCNLLYVVDQPFENIAVTFKGLVPEQNRFQAACTLMALLESSELQAKQRVVALYILYNLYNIVPILDNPFLLLFLNLYKSHSSNLSLVKSNGDLLVEYLVESLILSDKANQLADKTPMDVYKQFSNVEDLSIINAEEINIANFENHIKSEFEIQLPSSLISRIEKLESQNENKQIWPWSIPESTKFHEPSSSTSSYTTITSPSSSLNNPIIHNKPQNISSDENETQAEWDYVMNEEISDQKRIGLLMNKAFQTALSIREVECIDLIYDCELSPEKLPNLVENNPKIAVEVLLLLKSSSQIDIYLETLLTINMSLQSSAEVMNRMRSSMEVINRLTTSIVIPPELIHKFVTNCIDACGKDKNIQSRQVRLVCVFLLSLFRNNIIDPNEYFIELQAFCITYSRIREAVELFKYIGELNKDVVSDELNFIDGITIG